ncbi:HlyD family secretion protein [Vibrio cyclitrophicus]|nr:HlyD family secretion protein [Vibrio cyclitrophicus]UPR53741.1 HlyD family secretion protein [Vibrio cyclitrophicus]
MKKIFGSVLPVLVVVATYFVGNLAWNAYMDTPWTRDGRIQVEVLNVTPEVSGKIKTLLVKDNQEVKEGDLLIEIDDTDYALAVDKAKLKVQSLSVEVDSAVDSYQRNKTAKKYVTKKQLVEDQFKIKKLKLDLAQAEVEASNAELDLKRTKIYAFANGYVTNLNLREGNYVSLGQSLFALVESETFYLVGYFPETLVGDIELGQKAKAKLMIKDQEVNLVVDGIGRAIADKSADSSGLIANVNPTVPWVRLNQRVPVRFEITDDLATLRLAAGGTATIEVSE